MLDGIRQTLKDYMALKMTEYKLKGAENSAIITNRLIVILVMTLLSGIILQLLGFSVAFMAGEYEAPVNVVLEEQDGGTESAPITYRAYGDGDVIFNDSVTIKAKEFKAIDESEYSMFPAGAGKYIKKVDDLYADKEKEIMTV